ncbi:MAG: CDP-alcohol phosphatidyltransferase family protein [Spirochaetales bacterium]|nr:CDP-alcohol phosphatidyltransferase family protein [Spirochaetales bacterium]
MKKLIPNILSLSRIPLGLIFLFTFLKEDIPAVYPLIVLLLSMMTDFFDGFLARKYKVVSEPGKWLDPISDFLFYLIVYISFLINEILPLVLFILFLVREFVMYAIIRPLYVKKNLEVGAKLPGKIKTAFNGIGVLAIVLLSITVEWGIAKPELFRQSSMMILIVLISYSLISLYWYIKVFFLKNN